MLPVVERFIEALPLVFKIVAESDSDAAKTALISCGVVVENGNLICSDAGDCVRVWVLFELVMTELEGCKYSTLNLVLPLLDELCRKLLDFRRGAEFVDHFGEKQRPSPVFKALSKLVLEQLPQRFRIHPLHAVACVLHPHPSINLLSFLGKQGPGLDEVFPVTKSKLLSDAKFLIRDLVSKTKAASEKRDRLRKKISTEKKMKSSR